MLNKKEISAAWKVAFNEFQNNEDDERENYHAVVTDFVVDVIDTETSNLITALNDTNQLMSVLVADPLVQKDQKDFIRKRIETNKAIIKREGEKVNA